MTGSLSTVFAGDATSHVGCSPARSRICQTWSLLKESRAAIERWVSRKAGVGTLGFESASSPWVWVLLTCGAIHPVFRWMALRAADGSDEPWGLFALLAVAILVPTRHAAGSARAGGFLGFSVTMGIYVLSYPFLTPLPRGLVAMTALAMLLSRFYFRSHLNIGLWVLLLLSLPVMASLQFYAGYPLRIVVAELSAIMLRPAGFVVDVQGVGLGVGERMVMVDAPCSGVKMLWVGSFVASLMSVLQALTSKQTIVCMVGAAVLLLVANALRASALFYLELDLIKLPPVAHDLVGLVMFASTLVGIAALVRIVKARGHDA